MNPRKGKRTKAELRAHATNALKDDPLTLLSKRQLAVLFGVDEWTIDAWRRTDTEFPTPITFSRTVLRWRRSDIAAFQAKRAAEPATMRHQGKRRGRR